MTEVEGVADGFVCVGSGQLYYQVAGSGHPLVLIHGGWVDGRMWDEQLPLLARRFRVIRYDLRGHGRSSVGSEPYSHIDDLEALLAALDIDRVSLLGLSLGGSIAMAFAIAHPARVDALILASSGGVQGISFTDNERQRFAASLEAAQRGAYAEAIELHLQTWVDGVERSATPHVRERVRAMLLDHTFPQLAPGFPGVRWPETATIDHVQAIRAPVLILVGEHDQRILHRAADVYQAQLDRVQKVVLPGAAHMINLNQPEAFFSGDCWLSGG